MFKKYNIKLTPKTKQEIPWDTSQRSTEREKERMREREREEKLS